LAQVSDCDEIGGVGKLIKNETNMSEIGLKILELRVDTFRSRFRKNSYERAESTC
jgi:hypothetical protein